MECEEEFQGKRELDIHRFVVKGFETSESKLFLLDEYYSQAVNHCMLIMLVSLLVLLAIFLL